MLGHRLKLPVQPPKGGLSLDDYGRKLEGTANVVDRFEKPPQSVQHHEYAEGVRLPFRASRHAVGIRVTIGHKVIEDVFGVVVSLRAHCRVDGSIFEPAVQRGKPVNKCRPGMSLRHMDAEVGDQVVDNLLVGIQRFVFFVDTQSMILLDFR